MLVTGFARMIAVAIASAAFSISAFALNATWNAATDIPVTAPSYTATGNNITFTLNCVPTASELTVVKNTGPAFIQGTFSNLVQGQAVDLSYAGITYHFVANYYGGSGNDLVLVWAGTRVVAWGNNDSGKLGDGTTTKRSASVTVDVTGVLHGKTVISIAAGANHSMALCSDGTLAAWGNNNYGQLGDKTTTRRLLPVEVDRSGVLFGRTVVAIAAGDSHSLALCSDGTIAAWGCNSSGELGNNSTTPGNTPVAVNTASGISALSGKSVAAIAAGASHNLALCSDGTVTAWGYNFDGELGNNSTANSPVPVAVERDGLLTGKTIMSIATGASHSLALCTDGTLVAWGWNDDGELGNNTTTGSSIPVRVNQAGVLSGKSIVSIAAGDFHNLALCSDGTLSAWGANWYGELGNNTTTCSTTPVLVDQTGALAMQSVVSLAAGRDFSAASCKDGSIVAWGYNGDGALGNNSTTDSFVPVLASGGGLAPGEHLIAVSCGPVADFILALAATPPPPPSLMVEYPAGTALTNGTATIDFGDSFVGNPISRSLVIRNTGIGLLTGLSIRMGGSNSGDFTVTASPVAPVPPGGQTAITVTFTPTAAGSPSAVLHLDTNDPLNGSFAVKLAGLGTASGDLAVVLNAPTDIPASARNYQATGRHITFTLNCVPAVNELMVVRNTGPDFIKGRFANLAQGQAVDLSYAGQIYHFVANYYGGSGNDLTLAWAGTRAFAWGANTNGQLGDNTSTQRSAPVPVKTAGTALDGKTVIALAGGGNHSLALCSDGTVAAWGYNTYCQLGDNSWTQHQVPILAYRGSGSALFGKEVVAIAAGTNYSLALCSDGTVAAWGYNNEGQLGDNTRDLRNIPVAVNSAFGSALYGKTVTGISAGANHSLALCSDGTVVAWGDNYYGKLGDNSWSQHSVPTLVNTTLGSALVGKTVVAIAAGANHSLALCSDGTLTAWGNNNYGQLGNGSSYSLQPVVVNQASGSALFGKTVVAISAGDSVSRALCSDGTVTAWGNNSYGQLGDNTTTQRNIPVAVNSAPESALFDKTFTAVAAGANHGLLQCSDGTVAALGSNNSGQLGDTTTTQRSVPVAVSMAALSAGERFVMTASGCSASHTLAIVAPVPRSSPVMIVEQLDGTALGNGVGTIEFGSTLTQGPVSLSFMIRNKGMSSLTGLSFTVDGGSRGDFAITGNPGGTIASSGNATFTVTFTPPSAGLRTAALHITSNDTETGPFTINLAGTGTALGNQSLVINSPADVPITASSFSAAGYSIHLSLNCIPATRELMVVRNTGSDSIFGRFSNLLQGQSVSLSYGGKTYQFIANYFGGKGNDLVLVWAGTRALAWGANNSGQLGDHSETTRIAPVAVNTALALAAIPVTAVAGGGYFSMALHSDGSLESWGYNNSGQLGDNSWSQHQIPKPINTAADSALFGKTVQTIAAGDSHSLALCSDGTVAAWGDNGYGQLGDNTGSRRYIPTAANTASGSALYGKTVAAIAAGENYSLALCSDGTVAAWGCNNDGQLGDGTRNTRYNPIAVNTSPGTALFGKSVVAIAAGSHHSLALCSDGTLAAWGSNNYGELGDKSWVQHWVPTVVNAASGSALNGKSVVAIAAGTYHSMALCSDGTVAAWGANWYGQLGNTGSTPDIPTAVSTASGSALYGRTVKTIAACSNHCLALCSDGTVAGWGYNGYGQLGDNSSTYSYLPIAVNTSYESALHGKTVTGIAAGVRHSLAVCADGTVAAWGDNWAGELGDNSTTSRYIPTMVYLPWDSALHDKTVLTITSGFSHCLALCSDGTVAAWGGNTGGQVGDGTTAYRNVPVAVNNAPGSALHGRTVVAVAAGSSHSLALCSDGTVAAWGNNSDGQLGDNSITTQHNVPLAVSSSSGSALFGKRVVAIAAGAYHSMVLCSDGTVVTWGSDGNGQLGNGTGGNWYSPQPVAVVQTTGTMLYGKTVVSIAAGNNHSLALCSDGTLVSWGSNSSGQLGDNTTTDRHAPVTVTSATGSALHGKTVVAIAAGEAHSLALCSDGTVTTWGYNYYGQLGDKTWANRNLPVCISTDSASALLDKTVVAISAGANQSQALCSDGTVTSWGYNVWGQVGDNTVTNRNVPVAVNTAALAAGERFVMAASGCSAYHTVALVACAPPSIPLPPPVIGVEQPADHTLDSGTASVDFGSPHIGEAVSLTFGISNRGVKTLAGLAITVDGGNRGDFVVTTNPPDTLARDLVTTFSVTFTPSEVGLCTAALHIASNDPVTGNFTINLTGTGTTLGSKLAEFNTPADVPFTSSSYDAKGYSIHFTLNCVPPANGLMVIRNTGLDFIHGRFGNLAQGQSVMLNYAGITYNFVANYYGGSGNDLVLVWEGTRAFSWGSGQFGMLGNGSESSSSVPVPVDTDAGDGVISGKTVVALAAGQYHSVALCSDGAVAAWGSNNFGQLGNNTTSNRNLPTAISMASGSAMHGKEVVAVAAGGHHSLALCSDGTVAAWGRNREGQLGNNSTANSSLPVAVNATAGSALFGKTVVAITAGECLSMALCSDGTVAAWGSNLYGELGDDSTINRSVPVVVSREAGSALFDRSVVSISAGRNHGMALCSDGTVATWGDNYYGQVGDGTTTPRPMPKAVNTGPGSVLFGKTVVSVAAGDSYSLALCSDGTVATWGGNEYGQLGDKATTNRSVPVAVNKAWGSALQVRTVIGVTAGAARSLALCTDGALVAWGYNSAGQLGDNTRTNRRVPVTVTDTELIGGERFVRLPSDSASGNHSLALVSWPGRPIVSTLPATNLTNLGATLQGTVNANGAETSVTFEYGITTAYGNAKAYEVKVSGSPALVAGTSATMVNATLTGLLPGTQYHFRVNGGGVHGADQTFVTGKPELVSLVATDVTSNSAVLHGTVKAGGIPTAVGFEYGTTTSYGAAVTAFPSPVADAGETDVSATLTGLVPGTLYHFRVIGDSVPGGDQTFFTGLPSLGFPSPYVENIATTSATVMAIVNANGGNTAVTFEYVAASDCLTTKWNTVPGTPAWVSGSSDTVVSATLTGLSPGTYYYFRVTGDTVHGQYLPFITLGASCNVSWNNGGETPLFYSYGSW